MHDLISKAINWELVTGGTAEKNKLIFEIKDAVFHRDSGTLDLYLNLNFVIPYANLADIKTIIKGRLEEVKEVRIFLEYSDVVQSREVIIQLYIPYMIKILNGAYAAFTRSIDPENVAVEDDRVKISIIGITAANQLNEKVAGEFERILASTFDIKTRVAFINNSENYEELSKDFYDCETEDLKDKLDSYREEIKLEAGIQAQKPEPGEKKKNKSQRYSKKRDLPAKGNFVMGRCLTGEPNTDLLSIDPSMGNVIVKGTIFRLESKVIRSGSYIASVLITDNRTTVCCQAFTSEEKWKELESMLDSGDEVKVFGDVQFDTYQNMNVIRFNEIEKIGKPDGRKDTYPAGKRIELHLHTQMSQMDGFNDAAEAVKQAAEWGQPAIAITDHGVVQSFPDAFKAASELAKKDKKIKIIYGVEGYVFDDSDCILADGSIDYRKKQTNHIIILAKNQTGIKNIYKLVSKSHVDYFYRKPRLPWSLIEEHRDGLIIGSACCYGEVFSAMVEQVTYNKRTGERRVREPADREELIRIASRYDYLEIQPVVNNKFMINEEFYYKGKRVETEDDIRDINRGIIELADELGKPVAATTDSHYKEPEDAIYRNIIMAGQGYENAESGEGLYMKTTDEMMEEFCYLGERAREIVIDNTAKIADLCEDGIRPVPTEKCPPKIEGAEETLRKSCMEKAHEMYGSPLPEEIASRLETELNSIISNGYAVMYVSAQMLVAKSLSDGYLVGSRGSVGSSFAATMAGITEVNPLDPHYLCPNCHHLEWGDKSLYDCGVDMPPKMCPECGAEMKRDGFTIPFATFLGFKGDKEPDIDLNFAGEYQATAHKYVGDIFGSKNVFKAGTVGTIAEKTAKEYVRKYFEERGIPVNKYEAERLALQCTGVKRTTGQHPGGIVICPDDREIYDFCPIQHPADKADSDIITTHFDYHKIDENLLKLDILGHDVPSMIRQLQDMTGVDPLKVDLTDRNVLSIFNGTEALNIKDPDYKFVHGTYAIPEFGTSFVRKMLDDTKPDKFADLVRISGFSHGTDVWLNNAQDYILNGQATMREVISTRDDIMNYLILKGVENQTAFKIMEIVRKGKKDLDEEQVRTMKEHGVPDWYIESCNKIKYMFPRAHAAAYTMMSFRLAWYKVYYPQEFYAAYLTTKVSDFDETAIMNGKQAVLDRMNEIQMKGDNATPKEKNSVTVLEVAYEMYARGFEFEPAVLGESKALKFWTKNGKVQIPFVAIEGVGESAALGLCEAYEEKQFDTIEEAMIRGKLNKSVVEALKNYGVFEGLPETDQLCMF